MSLLLFCLSRVTSRVACFTHTWCSSPVFVSCELTVGRSASYLKAYFTFSIHTPPHSCVGHCCNQCLSFVTHCLVLGFCIYLFTSTSGFKRDTQGLVCWSTLSTLAYRSPILFWRDRVLLGAWDHVYWEDTLLVVHN